MNPFKVISYIKGLIKVNNEKKDSFQDYFLWDSFNIARAAIVSQQLTKAKYLSPNNYQTFCIELKEDFDNLCECKKFGCKVMKSIIKLPQYIVGNSGSSLSVLNLGNNPIDVMKDMEDINNAFKHDIYKNKPLAVEVNGYLYIYNYKARVVNVRAIWQDVTEIPEVQYCNTTAGHNPDCVDLESLNLVADKDLFDAIIKKLFESLGIPLRIPEDNTSDNNSNIKQ